LVTAAVPPLVLQHGVAHDLLVALIATWGGLEVLLRLRSIGSRKGLDWTFPIVVIAIGAGTTLAFRAAHVSWASIGGGWVTVTTGLAVAALGIGFRIWAILTLGSLFTFVVAIQSDHAVVDRGPYRLLRHPSYTGALVGFLGIGIALDNWLAIATIVIIPLAGVLIRIRYEERLLAEQLGTQYRQYAARTRRLIPGVW
jgi:protein-S-isoprenylcysteine O-methyltransferase Ste14